MTPGQVRERLRDILREHQPRDASELFRAIEGLIGAVIRATRERCASEAETMPAFASPKDVAAAIRKANQ